MRNAKIRFPLFKGHETDQPCSNSTLDFDKSGMPLRRWTVMISPNSEYPCSQIPNGTNPRGIDHNSNIIKDVKKAFKENNLFSCSNGGIGVIADSHTIEVVKEGGKEFVEFSCNELVSGHWDGQHTGAGVDDALNDGATPHRAVQLTIHDHGLYEDAAEIRQMARENNTRKKQRAQSEANQAGLFDNLKSELSAVFLKNIHFKENDLYPDGAPIPRESQVNEVYKIMLTFLGKLGVPGTGPEVLCKFPKTGGDCFVEKLEKNKKFNTLYNSLEQSNVYKHVNDVLSLMDYIQSNLDKVWQRDLSELKLIYHTNKLRKIRAFNGKQLEGALDKDLRPLLAYIMVDNCYEKQKDGTLKALKTLEEMKAIWLEVGNDVLESINQAWADQQVRYVTVRWSDFVADGNQWNLASKKVYICISEGAWKSKLNMKLKEAA